MKIIKFFYNNNFRFYDKFKNKIYVCMYVITVSLQRRIYNYIFLLLIIKKKIILNL